MSAAAGCQPSTGQWKDGVCSCLNQCVPTCCGACWCSPCLTGRFYDQFVKRGRYCLVVVVLLGLYVFEIIFSNIADSYPHKDYAKNDMVENSSGYEIFTALSTISGLLMWAATAYFVYEIRQAVRRKYQIPGDNTNDCCCSFWCNCCVLAQIYRHVKPTQGTCDDCDCNGLGPVNDNEVMCYPGGYVV